MARLLKANKHMCALEVRGLGPIFKLKLDIQNTGNRPIFNVPLVFSYNQQVYKLSEHMVNLPLLIPGVMYGTPHTPTTSPAFCASS